MLEAFHFCASFSIHLKWQRETRAGTSHIITTANSVHCLAADSHFRGGDAATAQYLLVLDALNFCFWPQQGLEYEHLARGLKVIQHTEKCEKTWNNCRICRHPAFGSRAGMPAQ